MGGIGHYAEPLHVEARPSALVLAHWCFSYSQLRLHDTTHSTKESGYDELWFRSLSLALAASTLLSLGSTATAGPDEQAENNILGSTATAGPDEQAENNITRLEHNELRNDFFEELVPDAPAVAPSARRLSVVGSLMPTYTSNALLTPDDPQSDFYLESDITLRLDGRLLPDVSYRLYARSELDAFADVQEANASITILGANFTAPVLALNASLIYENRHSFGGIYEDLAFVANDVKGTFSRDVNIGKLTVSPFVRVTQRFSDVPEARRFRVDLALGLEYELSARWSLVSFPFFEKNWFSGGLNIGRRDKYYSADIGLSYTISDNLVLTTSATHEVFRSNFPQRKHDVFDVSTRLDFVF